jgi:hypothetical protein
MATVRLSIRRTLFLPNCASWKELAKKKDFPLGETIPDFLVLN